MDDDVLVCPKCGNDLVAYARFTRWEPEVGQYFIQWRFFHQKPGPKARRKSPCTMWTQTTDSGKSFKDQRPMTAKSPYMAKMRELAKLNRRPAR